MKIKSLLTKVDHRPWDLPNKDWKFYQEWNEVIFLHWEIEPSLLRQHIPTGLELDTFNGKAWISIVAFTMQKVRPRFLPAISFVSDFDEINIRTYVKRDDKSGVYFLSIEAGKRLSSLLARTISQLPYRHSSMSRTPNRYKSTNISTEDHLFIEYEILDPLNTKTDLDRWLTERYALFQDSSTGINRYEIHHIPWPISNIAVNKLSFNYPRFGAAVSGYPRMAHYSSGVQVLAWSRDRLKSIKHGDRLSSS